MNNKLSNLRKLTLVSAIALVGLFLSFAYVSPIQTASVRALVYADGYDPHGGYLDKVTFVVYPPEDEQLGLQALQANIIYAWDERVPADNILNSKRQPVLKSPPNLVTCTGCSV